MDGASVAGRMRLRTGQEGNDGQAGRQTGRQANRKARNRKGDYHGNKEDRGKLLVSLWHEELL